MIKYKALPSREFLMQTYAYDPETGQFCWAVDSPNGQRFRGDQAGGSKSGVGFRIKIQGQIYPLPRIIWLMQTGEDPGDRQVDHINGNIYDNRFANLRLATCSENQANSTCSRKDRLLPRGVYRRGSSYRAMIKANGKLHCLGTYDTPDEAQQAWLKKAEDLWGSFATNRDCSTFYSDSSDRGIELSMALVSGYPSMRQVSLMAEKAGIADLAAANKLVRLTLDTFSSPLEPTSVAERLPQPEDCDAEGRCWVYCLGQSWNTWVLMVPQNAPDFAYWLPAHALPLPGGEVEA